MSSFPSGHVLAMNPIRICTVQRGMVHMKNMTIYILALGVFLTATSELVVSGILDVISESLHISVALAGQFVTVYSLAFAIGTPIVVSFTSRMGRKKVLIGALLLYILGCLISSISTNITMLILSRVILGVSAGVYLVVTFGATAKLVSAEKLGRSISIIVFGFSGAMILGVPIGIAISHWLNWQAIFMILGLLSALIMYVVYRLVPDIEGDAPVPFLQQFKVLGSVVIVSGLFVTFFKETGNSVLFTYLIPYMQNILHVQPYYSSIIMLVLGIFGAFGSRVGGYGVDRWGASRVIAVNIIIHIAVVALLPLFTQSVIAGLLLLSVMVLSMFATGPAIQSYFIQRAPGSANLVLSLNTSIIHLGLAAGAGAGGFMANNASTLFYHPWLASFILILGLAAAFVSFTTGRRTGIRPSV